MDVIMERSLLCPKCHQPIEGEEQYICCAAATLQWRCDDCGKVSEGFAFPYGMCPLCSGKLEMLSATASSTTTSALDAIRMAFEIELGGQAFYSRAAQQSTGAGAARAVRQVRGDGRRAHRRRWPGAIMPRCRSRRPNSRSERAAIYAGLENRPEDPANLIRIAISFEERAVQFFSRAGRTGAGRFGRAPALQGAGGRGTRARRPADHRVRALAGRQARPALAPAHQPGRATGAERMAEHFEAIVVGAGPAGNAAALTLARAGSRVLQLERSKYPGCRKRPRRRPRRRRSGRS